MAIPKSAIVLHDSLNLSDFKTDEDISVTTQSANTNNIKEPPMGDYSHIHPDGNCENDDFDEDGIYSPLPDDESLQDVTEEGIDKMFASSPRKTRDNLSQIQSPGKLALPQHSSLHAPVNQEKRFDSPQNGGQEFKEVSVQTRAITQNIHCPICKLENDDFKKRLVALFIEYSHKKQKIIMMENTSLNVIVDEHDMKKEIMSSDSQITPKTPLDVEFDKEGKRDSKESSSRKIRLGLSRRVKLVPLHHTPNSKKTAMPHDTK